MGVKLAPIVVRKKIRLEQLRGKTLAIDANCELYQFLSLIRAPDGSLLKDSAGNVTSHLVGLAFRTTRLIADYGVRPVFVFDGPPHRLKRREIERRRAQREKAVEAWHVALERGDYSTAFSKAVMTSTLTKPMIDDARRLLDALGVPFIDSPTEADAQIAYMARIGDAWAAGSKDFDCLLYGTPRLARFVTITGKEYLPSKGITRPLETELIELENLLAKLDITLEQLIDLAILIGTDYNRGVRGIGPVKALRLVKRYERIENMPEPVRENVSPIYSEVREIFLHPDVRDDYSLLYSQPKLDELFTFLSGERGFSKERVQVIVDRIKRSTDLLRQADLSSWAKDGVDIPAAHLK
jgi:flap endonuclease-1